MKKLALLSAAFTLSAASAAFAVQPPLPDKDESGVIMVYATDAAKQCFDTAQNGADLKFGLEHCNTAVIDPMTTYRAQTFVNRGIIRYDMGDGQGALSDFNVALTNNPSLGDAYLNRALVLISEKRPADALAAINEGIALGATNLQIAYYSRGEIEDDAGQYDAAYRDYRQALEIKPDYSPAERQLARFKVVPPTR
ncbi:MAG TPA: tetratricopeptide repeat protein [Rhizomicrobium sp.]|nr:tetratricopeptide repeat protein [Rhizomicrobium sp.]